MEQEVIRMEHGAYDEGFLFDISLRLCRGNIHGFIFDNVLEERYLFDLFRGIHRFTNGKIYVDDMPLSIAQARDYFSKVFFFPALGIQDSQELTVMDAFFIQQTRKDGFYKNTSRLKRQMETMMEVFSVSWSFDMLLRDMNPLQRVELELIRGFRQGYSIIILKNLTAVLNSTDIGRITLLFRELLQRGMTFLMVDYDQPLLRQLADDITIISNGRTTFHFLREEFDPSEIQKVLLGKHITQHIDKSFISLQKEVLRFSELTTGSMSPLNISIRQGECLVLLDKEGYYGNDIIAVLQGEKQDFQGEMYLKGHAFQPKSPMDAVNQGVCVIQENPIAQGKNLFHNISGIKNLSLMTTEKVRHPFLTRSRENSIRLELSQVFTKKQLQTQVANLDPLTRQKLVYYKYFIYYPHLIICVKPLSGGDIRMREFTQDMIQEYRTRGIAVLIITTNISEAYSFQGQVLKITPLSLKIDS